MNRAKLVHIALMILLIAAMLLSLQGCATHKVQSVEDTAPPEQEQPSSMFVEVESTNMWCVMYHKDTKVMYAVSHSGYNCGNFTLLVDATGNPLLYTG